MRANMIHPNIESTKNLWFCKPEPVKSGYTTKQHVCCPTVTCIYRQRHSAQKKWAEYILFQETIDALYEQKQTAVYETT